MFRVHSRRTAGARRETPVGRLTRLVSRPEAFPFSFQEDDVPGFFPVLTLRDRVSGIRFYGEAMRRGERARVDGHDHSLEALIGNVEAVADSVGTTIQAGHGALLVVNNWKVLHDRLNQSKPTLGGGRRSLISFVWDMN